jgi:hypothetical protein
MNVINLILYLPSLSIGIFPLLTIFGSLQALLEYRKNIKNTTGKSLEEVIPLAQGLFSFIFSNLSGSILVAILLSQPPGWIYNNGVIPTFILVFSLQYFKEAFPIRICERYHLLRLIIACADSMSYGFSITSFGVDLALASLGNKKFMSGAILCGFVSGIGCQLMKEAFHLHDKKWYFSTPSLFAMSHQYLSSMVYMSLWSSTIYYLGLKWNLMCPETWKVLNIILLGLYNSRQSLSFIIYFFMEDRGNYLSSLKRRSKSNIFSSIFSNNALDLDKVTPNEE